MPTKKGIMASPATGQGDSRTFGPSKPPFRHRLPLMVQDDSADPISFEELDLILKRVDSLNRKVKKCFKIVQQMKEG